CHAGAGRHGHDARTAAAADGQPDAADAHLRGPHRSAQVGGCTQYPGRPLTGRQIYRDKRNMTQYKTRQIDLPARRTAMKRGAAALGMAALATNGVFLTGSARAQAAYPSRAVRFVIPFPPGTGTDATARIFAKAFSEY